MREDWGKMSRHSSAKKGKKKQKEVMVKDVAVAAIVDIDEQIRKEERRRKKLIKRAKSQAKLFAELGLDENGNPFDNFSLLKYPVREWILTLPGLHDPIALNPVVSMLAIVSLWGLVLWTAGKV